MHYTTIENRDRHAVVDSYLAEARQMLLEDPVYMNCLSQEISAAFDSFTQNYTVPDIRHGKVILSAAMRDSEKDFVIAVEGSEKICLDENLAVMSEQQKGIVADFWGKFGVDDPKLMTDQLQKAHVEVVHKDPEIIRLADTNAGALVAGSTRFYNIGDEKQLFSFVVSGRPIMIIGNNPDHVSTERSNTVGHEYRHMWHDWLEPIIHTTDTGPHAGNWTAFNDEVPAYDISANLAAAKEAAGYELTELELMFKEMPEIVQDMLADKSSLMNKSPYAVLSERMSDRKISAIIRSFDWTGALNPNKNG